MVVNAWPSWKRTVFVLASCEGTRRDNLNGLTVIGCCGAERVPDAGDVRADPSIEEGSTGAATPVG